MIKIMCEEIGVSKDEIISTGMLPDGFMENIHKNYKEIYEESLRGQG